MQIGLLGYGKMGREVESVALKRGHQVVFSTGRHQQHGESQEANIFIDFSHSTAIQPHLQIAIRSRSNLLIGTTGWEESLSTVKELVGESGIGLLYAPNFSLGVQVFKTLVKSAAQRLQPLGYRVGLHEIHHEEKKDAPSGTALWLADLLEESGCSPSLSFLREGRNPGRHEVGFDSTEDTISLVHQAHNRKGFALGAVIAAEWLQGKKGFYTIDDVMEDLYGDN